MRMKYTRTNTCSVPYMSGGAGGLLGWVPAKACLRPHSLPHPHSCPQFHPIGGLHTPNIRREDMAWRRHTRHGHNWLWGYRRWQCFVVIIKFGDFYGDKMMSINALINHLFCSFSLASNYTITVSGCEREKSNCLLCIICSFPAFLRPVLLSYSSFVNAASQDVHCVCDASR